MLSDCLGVHVFAATTNPSTVADQFKLFIASPPAIEEFVFKYRDISTWDTQRVETVKFYLCRWQSNAFAMKECDDLLELKSDRVAKSSRTMGYYGSNYWMTTQSEMTTSTCDNPIDETNYLRSTVQAMQNIQLSTAFNMGIPNVKIATVRWEGERFTATTHNGHLIHGELVSGQDGKATRLKFVRDLAPGKVVEMTVEYEFAKNIGLSFLPNIVRRLAETANGPQLSAEIELLSIKPSADALPERLFAGDQFVPSQLKYSTKISMGVPVRSELLRSQEVRKGKSATILVIVMLALTSTFGIFLLLKGAKKERNST